MYALANFTTVFSFLLFWFPLSQGPSRGTEIGIYLPCIESQYGQRTAFLVWQLRGALI